MAKKTTYKIPGTNPATNVTQLSGMGSAAVAETDNKPDYKAAIRALQNSEKTDHSTWRVVGEGIFGAKGEDSTSLMASMLSQGDRDKTYDMLSGLNPTDPGAAAARQAYMQHVDYEREQEEAKALQEAARYAGGYAGSRTAAENQYVGEVPQFDAARVKASAPSTVTAEADRMIRQIEQMMRQAGRTGLGSTAELEAQLAQAQKERQAALDAYAAQIREEYRQANRERSRAAGERKSEQIGLLDLREADAQTNRDNRAALARALAQNDSHAQLEQALYAAQGANDQAEVERIQRELTRLDNPTAPVTIEDLQAERDRLQRAYNEAGMRAYAGGGRGETPAQMREIRDAMEKIDARIEAKQTAQSTGAADRALETEIQTYHDFATLDVEALENQIGVYDSLIEFARSRQSEALNDPAVRTGLRDKADTPWKKWVNEEARLRALRDEAQEKLDAKQRYDRSLSDNDRRMLQQIENAKQNLDRTSAAAQAYADTLHEKQEDYQEARRAYREERANADAYAWKSGQYYAAVKAYNYALQSGADPENLDVIEQKAEALAFETDAAYKAMYEPYAQGEAAAALNQAAKEVNAAAYKYSLTAQRVEDRVGAYYKAYDALAADRASLPKEYYTAYENVVGLTALIDGYHEKLDALYEEENALLAQGQSGSLRAQEIDGLIGEYNRKITDWMLERAQYYSYAYTYDYARTMAELPEEDRKKFEAILTGNTKDRDTLLEKYGKTKYERTLEMVQRAYNEEQRKKQQAQIQNLSGLEAVNASIASVASNLLSAPGVLYEIIRQGAGNYGSIANYNAYHPYDTNAAGFAAQNFTRDVRGVIGARIEQDMLAAGSSAEQAHWGSIAYATVLSGLDSLLAMGVGSAGHAMGISAELGGHLLGVTAAANSMQDIAERGGNLGEILVGGTIAGIFEGLFENWSIENFRALTQKEIVHNVGEMLENIGKSMLTNFSEEANTELANIAYDVVTGMLGMPSEWKDRFDELKRQEKLTDSQAFKAVAAEIGVQILEAGASGALMGFGFGMLGSVENRLKGYMQDIVEGGVRRGIALRFDRVADRNANLLPEYQVDLTYTAGTTTAADVREMAQQVYDAEVKQNAARKAAEQAHPEETERVQAKAQELAEVRVRTTATAADISAQAEAGAQAGETDAEIAREGTENARESARIAENAISSETTVNTARAEAEQAEAAGRGDDAENAYAREEARQIVDELAEQYADMDMLAYAVNDRADVFERQEGWPEMAQALRQELAERQAGSVPAETPSVASGNAMESAQAQAQAQAGQIVNRILAETEGNDAQVREAIYAEAENQRAAGNDAVADEIINQYETMWAEQQEEDQRSGVYSDRGGERDAGTDPAEGRAELGESAEGTHGAAEADDGRREGGNGQAERAAARVIEAQKNKAPKIFMREISTQGRADAHVTDITASTQDPELAALKKRADADGVKVRFVLGSMKFVGLERDSAGHSDGYTITVRVDHPRFTATQLYDHEWFHVLKQDHPGLVSRVFDAVQSKYLSFGMDMQEMYDAYADAYEGAFRDLDAEERDARIREEICADCYAGRGFGDWGQEEMRSTAQAAAREVTGESYRDVRPEATQTQQETREGGRNMALDDATEENHFTMDDVNTLRQIGDRKSVVDFSGEDIKKAEPWARMFYHELKEKSPFFRAWFGDWRIQDKTSLVIPEIDISAQRNSGNAINRDTGRKMSWDRGFLGESLLYTNKQNRGKITALCANIEEIVKDSILFDTRVSEKNSKRKMDGIAFMHSFYALVHYQDQTILVKMFAEEAVSPKTGEDFIRSYMLRALEEVADLGNSVHSDFGGLTEPTSATSIYTVSDLFDLVKRYDKDFRYSEPSKVVNEDGTPKVVYHQTSGDFWTFDNSNPAAGANDSETPNGYFFKDNDHDIGLGGNRQMAVYLNMKNPLHFASREEANRWYCEHIEGYAELQAQMQNRIQPIDSEMDRIENDMFADDVSDEQYQELDKKWNDLLNEMHTVEDDYRGRLREMLNTYFLDGSSGYDGIILDDDGHRYVNGKREDVKSYIVFDRRQIKSATDNIGTYDRNNPVIRFALDEAPDSETRTGELEQEIEAGDPAEDNAQEPTIDEKINAAAAYIELDDWAQKAYDDALAKEDTKTADLIQKQRAASRMAKDLRRQANREKAAFKKDGDEAHVQRMNELRRQANEYAKREREYAKQTNVKTAPSPVQTIRRTADSLLKMWHVAPAQQYSYRQQLQGVLEGIYRKGYVGDSDVSALFRAMFDDAVDTVNPDPAYEQVAEMMRDRHIYVSDQVRAEFGDDWESFRRAMWGARMIASSNTADRELDSYYQELAAQNPGIFDPEVADGAVQLQAIYDAVKQGRPKEVPLREAYQMQGLDDEAVFENMYTTAEGILQQFANTADLESRLTRDAEETETNLRGQLREERAAHKERLEQARAAFAEQQQRQRQRREQVDLMRRIRNDLRMLERRATHHDEAYARAMSAQDEETRRVMNTVLENVSTVANSITGKKLNNLLELQAAYQSMADTNPNFISDPKIEQLLARIGKVHLTDFSVEDLEAIVEAIQRISHQIKIENDMLDEMWQESLSEAGDAMREETRQAKGRKNSRFFSWVEDSLSLSRGLKRLGGWNPNSQMWRLAEAFERGDMDAMAYQEGADMVLQPFLARRNNDARRKWLYTAAGKNAEFAEVEVPRILGWDQGDAPISDENGPATIKLQMTQMQLVELALAMKNPDNMRHIKYGGLTVPDANLYKDGHLQDAIEAGQTVKLGPDVVRRIVSENLKPEGKEFAELLDKYYNSWAKTRINGISQKLEGVDRAINRNYYPIKTDKGYLETTYNIFDGTIEGMGPLKARIHSATAPIILGDADSTYKWHRDMMARYVGYAIPMRNFRELMNYAPGFGMQKNNAVIASVYKHGATEFLNDFAKVVETGDLEESKGLNKIVGRYINQVLSANISSMLKQFAALALAGSSYGQGSILRGITNLKAQVKTDPAIIRLYTPYLDMRNQELLYDQVTDIVRDKAGSVGQIALATALGRNWMNATDYWANRMMWAAAEDVVRRQNPNLRPGTEAEIKAGKDLYYKEVARVFNRITFDTQTNSNMMSKPNILRRKDSGIKAWTMFRTDAYQMAGIFREALGQAQWAEAHGTDAEKSAAKRKMANAIVGTLTSSMTSAAMGILANILRRRDKDLRDEEGNVDWKKIGTKFAVDSFESLTSCVLAGSEIFSFLAAQFVEGADWYDISSAPLDAVNDLLNTVQTQSKKIFQALRVFAESDAQYKAANADDLLAPVWKLGKAAAQFFGLPAANIEKNILAVLGWIWPEAAVAVQDVYTEYAKKDLEGKTGAELRATLKAYLSDEVGELSDAAIDEYMRLYELLGASVLPNANTPGEITTEDEEGNTVKQEVSSRDAGIWDNTYRETMIELINSMVDSDAYKALTDDEKKKMMAKIRSYASEAGKRAIGSDVKDWVEHVHAAADEGVQIADALLYYALSAGGKAADKMQILRDMDMTDAQKRIILDVFEPNMSGKIVAAIDGGASADAAIGYYIGQSTAEGVKNGNGATIAGSRQLAQFDALEAMDIPDEEKAAIYHAMYQSTAAAWADAADTMTDMEFLEYAREHFAESRQNIEGKTIPQDTPDTPQPEEKQTNPEYEAAVGAGLSETGAQAAVQAVSALSADASTYQKREAAVLALDDLSDQLAAVQYYSDKPEADYARFSAANGYGVTPKDYYTFYRDATAQYGKLSQKEAKAALDGMDLTQEQKAAMWQLCGANWKAANNPYAVYVSEQVRDAYYSVDTVSRSMPGMTDEIVDEYTGGNRPNSRRDVQITGSADVYRRGYKTPGTVYANGSDIGHDIGNIDIPEPKELISLDGTTNLSDKAKAEYEALKSEGMHYDGALRVVRGLEAREEMAGETDAQSKQRQAINIIANASRSAVNWEVERSHMIDNELVAIRHYSEHPDADYARFQAALDYGVDPALFVEISGDIMEEYDPDEGRVTQNQVKAYLDSYLPDYYTQEQKAAIWQLMNETWNAKDNPYATYVGEQIKDAYDANR